jgi:hypothetical protein
MATSIALFRKLESAVYSSGVVSMPGLRLSETDFSRSAWKIIDSSERADTVDGLYLIILQLSQRKLLMR